MSNILSSCHKERRAITLLIAVIVLSYFNRKLLLSAPLILGTLIFNRLNISSKLKSSLLTVLFILSFGCLIKLSFPKNIDTAPPSFKDLPILSNGSHPTLLYSLECVIPPNDIPVVVPSKCQGISDVVNNGKVFFHEIVDIEDLNVYPSIFSCGYEGPTACIGLYEDYVASEEYFTCRAAYEWPACHRPPGQLLNVTKQLLYPLDTANTTMSPWSRHILSTESLQANNERTTYHVVFRGEISSIYEISLTYSAIRICEANHMLIIHNNGIDPEYDHILNKIASLPCVVVLPYDVNAAHNSEEFKLLYSIYGNSENWNAHSSDYIRMDVLYRYGGVYIDADVLLRRPFGQVSKLSLFSIAGVELNNGIIAAPKGDEYLKWAMDTYIKTYRNDLWSWNGPQILHRLLVAHPNAADIYTTKAFYGHTSPVHFLFIGAYETNNILEGDLSKEHIGYHMIRGYKHKLIKQGSDICNLITAKFNEYPRLKPTLPCVP